MRRFFYLMFLAFSLAPCWSTEHSSTTREPQSYNRETPQTASATKAETRESNVNAIDMVSLMNDCNNTFRTEMANIESLNKSGSFPDETDKTAKCFVRCVLEKAGVMSEDGAVDSERALVFFATERSGAAESDFRDSTTACSNRNETCMCDRSYQFVKCVVEMELDKYYALKILHQGSPNSNASVKQQGMPRSYLITYIQCAIQEK